MDTSLKICFFQADLFWHNPKKNLDFFEAEFEKKLQGHDLVVLPEMFTTGFSMESEILAEDKSGMTTAWLRNQSKKYQTAIVGSIIFKENEQFFNRLFVALPDGALLHYDKKHLFRPANEHLYYAGGQERLVFEWKNWKICPLICYDLRFPVWSRNVWNAQKNELDYDLLLYVANFPAARALAWKTLLRARAVENLAFCIGVNRSGTDGKGIFYSGDSAVVDYTGACLTELGENEYFGEIILQKEHLLDYRNRFPAYLDADNFEIFP